jgi:hypothetical protein
VLTCVHAGFLGNGIGRPVHLHARNRVARRVKYSLAMF